MTIPEDKVEELKTVLQEFVLELNERVGTHTFEEILADNYTLESRDVDQAPETFTEDYLIWEILEVLDLEKDREPYGPRNEWPDFELTNIEAKTIGENKALNKISMAEKEIQDYLDRKSIGAEYGIATDGFEWKVYKIELSGDLLEYPVVAKKDLRNLISHIAANQGILSTLQEIDIDEKLRDFLETFWLDNFEELLSIRAPRKIRDDRKKDIDDFYDLYTELLFGDGDEYDYDSNLLSDIIPPRNADKKNKRLFGITLVNRLLFIRFLEDRGVLPEGFLKKRVNFYQENKEDITGRLYSTQIEPLFYELLNTPKEDRSPGYKGGWFEDVPYLNGGLFRQNIEHEREYRVRDRILPTLIRDLIEGHKLGFSSERLDPNLLGSVFEKTINHMAGEENKQKDMGAYYTPNDVTQLIVSQTIDKKIRDVLIETIAESISDEDSAKVFKDSVREKTLEEILRHVEQRESWYGEPDIIKNCQDNLESLKILDPACGSGHFLTAAIDEIYRAILSLKRGLKGDDEEISTREKYDIKQELALNCIYGVDVDEIASEIAKLRVWLKIVEENGWLEEFGKLPNIDINIKAGNSLIGFPHKGTIQSFETWNNDIKDLIDLRKEYKFESDGDKHEILNLLEDIRYKATNKFLNKLNYKVKSKLTTVEEFENITDTFGPDDRLNEWLGTVQVANQSQDELGDEIKDILKDLDLLDFNIYDNTARVSIIEEEKEEIEKGKSVRETRNKIFRDLKTLLNHKNCEFAEFEHKPTHYELNNILGIPFHWPIEFPEVATTEGPQHKMKFDVIIGNPPYGGILNNYEKVFMDNFVTSSINDIAAQFVERELELLTENGHFGNITTLRLIYQGSASCARNLLKDMLNNPKIACFATRPAQIFPDAEVNLAITTGQKVKDEGTDILTSDFIRFNANNRKEILKNIKYESTRNLVLGKKIGEDGNKSLPKIGYPIIRNILLKLKSHSDTILGEKHERGTGVGTDYVVWRSYHPRYWLNPFLENIYPNGGAPRDFEAMYFETDLERKTAFLIMQSSLFYLYWMVYENERDCNWKIIDPFPFPEEDKLAENAEEICSLADELWAKMVNLFNQNDKRMEDNATIKPTVDKVDDLLGDFYGLTDEEVDFIKNYHTEYGRSQRNHAGIEEYAKNGKM